MTGKKPWQGIFLDFYGTVVHEYGAETWEVIDRVYKCGRGQSQDEVLAYWWRVYSQLLNQAWGENFAKQLVIAEEAFRQTLDHFQGQEDPADLCRVMAQYWSKPQLYPDAAEFFHNCPLPIFLITNCDNIYIDAAVANLGLKPQAIFTSEDARATKPNPGIFQYALDHSGLAPGEVLHIGDSLTSDVQGATALGLDALWLNRKNQPIPQGVADVTSLTQAIEYIKKSSV